MEQSPLPQDEATRLNFVRHDVFSDVYRLEVAITDLHEHPKYLLQAASQDIQKCASRLLKLVGMLQPIAAVGNEAPIRTGLMRPAEAAEYLRTSTATLARLRRQGDGPEYSKFGVRILYSKNALDKFLASQ